jgi:hypothetical protein
MIYVWKRVTKNHEGLSSGVLSKIHQYGIQYWLIPEYAEGRDPRYKSLVEVRDDGIWIAPSSWSAQGQVGPFESVEDAQVALETMIELEQEPKWEPA